MKPLTKNQTTALQIFCILILIFLNLAVWYNGKSLDCDNCAIRFEGRKRVSSASNEIIQDFSVGMNELYEGLLKDYCSVEFDTLSGFIYKNETQIE